jgi:hypothetical protein
MWHHVVRYVGTSILDETTTSFSRVEGSRKVQQIHFESSFLFGKLHGITSQSLSFTEYT